MKVIILVKTAPILAWTEPRSLPIFPCKALSHLIRLWSGCGWLRGKRQSHRMNISNIMHNCRYRVVSLPLDERRTTTVTDNKIDFWSKPLKANLKSLSQKCTNMNFQTIFQKKIILICLFSSFSDPTNNFLGQGTVCLHCFNRDLLVTRND